MKLILSTEQTSVVFETERSGDVKLRVTPDGDGEPVQIDFELLPAVVHAAAVKTPAVPAARTAAPVAPAPKPAARTVPPVSPAPKPVAKVPAPEPAVKAPAPKPVAKVPAPEPAARICVAEPAAPASGDAFDELRPEDEEAIIEQLMRPLQTEQP